MADNFNKTVGSLSLVIESNDSGINSQCVRLQRHDNAMQGNPPLRMTLDELRDLQYLVNRAIGG